jgi:hypothetical protein
MSDTTTSQHHAPASAADWTEREIALSGVLDAARSWAEWSPAAAHGYLDAAVSAYLNGESATTITEAAAR